MKKRLVYLLSMIIISIGLCTGCDNADQSEISLAVIAGTHANAPDIPLGTDTIREALYESCYTFGSVSMITVDDNPRVYYQTSIPEPDVRGLTDDKKKSIAMNYTNQLLGELAKSAPAGPEADTLKAIQIAAKTLECGSETSDKVMIIMDSGLSTTGYLDFTKDLLNAEPESIVEALRQAEAIPDLYGVRIIWMFQGQTAFPQEELSERQKNKLQEIWQAVFRAGGAEEISFTSDIASDQIDHNYPRVSVVDVEERNIIVQTEAEKPMETIILDNASFRFVGNKAVFTDNKAAEERLKQLGEQLKAHPECTVYVVGTTASGNQDFCRQLSMDRAQVVTDILIDCGVQEEQLIPVGLGYDADPWHVDDVDESGRQIEEKACQNRKVLIIDKNSSDAEKLE